MKRKVIIGVLVFYLIVVACNVPRIEQAPISYVFINKMHLKTSPLQGTDRNNFRDAWAYVDGSSIGVYELPRKIAVVGKEDGSSIQFSVQAGIRENGVNSAPKVYPFTGNYEVTLDLEEGEEIELSPEFQYIEATKFRLIADFESGNLFTFDEDGDSTTTLVLSDDTGASSAQSGKIAVPSGKVFEQASTFVYNDFPKNGSPIYLEIDFKGDRELDIGLIGIDGEQLFKDYFVSLRSSGEWKKAYINLTELIVASNLAGYQLLISVDNSSGDSDKVVYVDNIKLLHF